MHRNFKPLYTCFQTSFGLLITVALLVNVHAQTGSTFPTLPEEIDGYLSTQSPTPDTQGGVALRFESVQGWNYEFPRDHFAHHRYRSEIWSLHALLQTDSGNTLALQSRFIRTAIKSPPVEETALSDWHFHEVFSSLQAITDVQANQFQYQESVSRGSLNLAGSGFTDKQQSSSVDKQNSVQKTQAGVVWVNSDKLLLHPDQRCGVALTLHTRIEQIPVAVNFNSIDCPLALSSTLSPSIPGFAQPVAVSGGQVASARVVTGLAWFERVWGDLPMGSAPVVNDLFRLVLPDNRYLLLVRTRRRDGSGVPVLSSVLSTTTEQSEIDYHYLQLEDDAYWTSKVSGKRYSSAWKIRLPGLASTSSANPERQHSELILSVNAVQQDQEMQSLGLFRWTGLVEATWEAGGVSHSALGFADLAPQLNIEATQ